MAAIRPTSASKINKLDAFFDSGILMGGESGRIFSLLEIKRSQQTGKKGGQAERITIGYGDEMGRKVIGKTGFFHVSLEQNPPRLVIDLSQVQKTAIDEKQLAAVFKNSDYISNTQMTMDPEDLSTNITLFLKNPVKARVHTNKNLRNPGQVVIDIMKQGSTHKNLNKGKK